MIEIKRYNELNDLTRDKINSYIDAEFGHIPIVNETEWSQPDWTITYSDEGEIKMFYNIVEREILIDDLKMKIGGINNVITPEKFRGNGYASQTLRGTEGFIFEELNCALGVLLCADNLIPYYQKLNWYVVNCPVYFQQESGTKTWEANTMLLTRQEKVSPLSIKLNGLPW